MSKRIITLVLVVLAGCRDEVTMLSGADLAALLAEDRKISFRRVHSGTAQFRTDGTFAVTIPRLGRDTGEWWFEENRICSRWQTFRRGRVLCARVGRLPDGTYRGLLPTSDIAYGDFRFDQ